MNRRVKKEDCCWNLSISEERCPRCLHITSDLVCKRYEQSAVNGRLACHNIITYKMV
ncbi:hypothetical protein EG68_12346 [Paragonimus skrjabini miyazakii]|uniref:Uncharacterized protein n=1 Tax=Paragonimus skrjabini miyazakii TaxID=59628 RepID=A0A8S9YR60_9TREM|nr:hypothetical protein EG68_12346 [Paragonimus skrjabini miyazakii]